MVYDLSCNPNKPFQSSFGALRIKHFQCDLWVSLCDYIPSILFYLRAFDLLHFNALYFQDEFKIFDDILICIRPFLFCIVLHSPILELFYCHINCNLQESLNLGLFLPLGHVHRAKGRTFVAEEAFFFGMDRLYSLLCGIRCDDNNRSETFARL